jgi:hypothetical protein
MFRDKTAKRFSSKLPGSGRNGNREVEKFEQVFAPGSFFLCGEFFLQSMMLLAVPPAAGAVQAEGLVQKVRFHCRSVFPRSM